MLKQNTRGMGKRKFTSNNRIQLTDVATMKAIQILANNITGIQHYPLNEIYVHAFMRDK